MPLSYADAAFHEAAHAVVRLEFAIPLHQVTILREPLADGCCGFVRGYAGAVELPAVPSPVQVEKTRELVRKASPEEQRDVRAFIAVSELECYAGIGAEDAVSAGDWYTSDLVESSETDRWNLRELLFNCLGTERPEFDWKALRRARRFVDKRWGRCRVLARELLARLEKHGAEGTLFGAEARALVACAPRERNPWRERDWTRREWEAVREEMRREIEQYEATWRERNVERVVNLPARSAGRSLQPAPLAALSRTR